MAKRVKTKKGSIGKKALAAILAASMVLSSSAFSVLAAEADVMPIAEAVNYAGGLDNIHVKFTDALPSEEDGKASYEYIGEEIHPKIEVTADIINSVPDAVDTLVAGEDYTLTYDNATNVPAKGSSDEPTIHINFMQNYADRSTAEINYGNLGKKDVQFVIKPVDLSKTTTVINAESLRGFNYNGGKQTPVITEVKTTVNGALKTLEKSDYEVVGVNSDDLTNVGTHKVTVKGIGNFDGTAKEYIEYTISKANLSKDMVKYETKSMVYPVDSSVDMSTRLDVREINSNKLLDTSNFDYTYWTGTKWDTHPQTDIGTHTFRITAKATNLNYNADNNKYFEGTYEVVGTSLETAAKEISQLGNGTISNGKVTFTYNKDNKWPGTGTEGAITSSNIKLGGSLILGSDYEIATDVTEWKNVGTYELKLKGKNNYRNQEATIPVEIVPKHMSAWNDKEMKAEAAQGITINAYAVVNHFGTIVRPTVEVKDGNDVLEEDKDYTCDYVVRNKVSYAIITGKNNYTTDLSKDHSGVVSVEVKAVEKGDTKVPLNHPTITAKVTKSYNYTGSSITVPETDFEVVENDGTNTKKLVWLEDYQIKRYENNVKAGEATVTLEGKGDYKETVDVKFKITGKPFEDTFTVDDIESMAKDADVTVEKVLNSVVVRWKENNAIYNRAKAILIDKNGKKYHLDNTSEKSYVLPIGQYTIEVSDDSGAYEGTIVKDFTVVGEKIADDIEVTVADATYTGEELSPEVIVKKRDGSFLAKGTDYTVTYDNNINAGKGYVTILMIGQYSGEAIISFNIAKADASVAIDDAQKNSLANGVAAGSTMGLDLVTTLADGKAIPDDTLTYTAESDATDIVGVDGTTLKFEKEGTANVTITPASSNLNLTPVSITVPVKVTAKTAKLTASCTPSRLKNKKNSFTVTTNTVKGADKWIIRYSLKNLNKTTKGSAKATFKDVNKVKQQVVKVNKSGAKYYVQCRVVKDGVKSAWSKVKTVKSR